MAGGASVPWVSHGCPVGQELPRCRVWDPPQDPSSSRRGDEEIWDVAVGALLGRVGQKEPPRCLQPGPDPSPKHPALGCGIIPGVKLTRGVSSPRGSPSCWGAL